MMDFHRAASGNGNGNAHAVPENVASLGVQVLGTFTGTFTFEGSLDEATWATIQGTKMVDGTKASTVTAPGLFQLPVAGLKAVRIPLSGLSAGTPTCIGRWSKGAPAA